MKWITRFIDSDAEFLFVPVSQIEQAAKEIRPIPFDAPGAELGLKEPGLLHVAKIVHAADVAKDMDTDPTACSLEAIASGYRLRFPDTSSAKSKCTMHPTHRAGWM